MYILNNYKIYEKYIYKLIHVNITKFIKVN